MKLFRYLVARLPWVAAGIGIGAAAVWLARDRGEVPAPGAPEPAAAAPVAPAAPNVEDSDRARKVGEALARVKPGMTRREVEAILGPPDLERWQQVASAWRTGPDGKEVYVDLQYVIYYCSPPHLPPGRHLMTVEYESKPLVPVPPDARVASVSGPHTPDSGG